MEYDPTSGAWQEGDDFTLGAYMDGVDGVPVDLNRVPPLRRPAYLSWHQCGMVDSAWGWKYGSPFSEGEYDGGQGQ